MIENWLPIPGFPGYEVSDMGRVRSLKRATPRILSPSTDTKGYHGVGLCINGVAYFKKIHPLVMLAFVGPYPENMEICHNDGDPDNNRLSNLRYDTHSENMRDAAKAGTLNPKRYLTNEQAKEVRDLFSQGVSRKEIAKRYSVPIFVIYQVLRGKTHRSAPGEVLNLRNFLDERAKSIREEYATKQTSMEKLAQKHRIDIAAVSRIINGKSRIKAGGPIKGRDY